MSGRWLLGSVCFWAAAGLLPGDHPLMVAGLVMAALFSLLWGVAGAKI